MNAYRSILKCLGFVEIADFVVIKNEPRLRNDLKRDKVKLTPAANFLISSILTLSSNWSSYECWWYAFSILSTFSMSMLISANLRMMYSFSLSELVNVDTLSRNTKKDCGVISWALLSSTSILNSVRCFSKSKKVRESIWDDGDSGAIEMFFEISCMKSSQAFTACSFFLP